MTCKNKYLSNIFIPISLGEIIDKIIILQIKTIHMTDIKLKNVKEELESLQSIRKNQV